MSATTTSASSSDTSVPSAISLADGPQESALIRKITLRLVPFLFFLYVVAYLDRVNVGFAKLDMKSLPWFSEGVFGTGAGIFFIGYFLFEIPSNLLLQRFGAKRWIMRIMLTWGVIAACMALVNSVPSFYGLRFLLGFAEAGFFPGVLLYLTYWFKARERAKVVAWFMTANAIAFIFGGPLSGWLLSHTLLPGLHGWQQMFILEGIPACLLGFVVLGYLPDGPREASWLTDSEKARVAQRLEGEVAPHTEHRIGDLVRILPSIGISCGVYFFLVTGMYGISMWLPEIIKSFGNKDPLAIGLLSAVPYLTAGTVMVLNGYHSDATGERRWHVAAPAFVGCIGLVACAYVRTPALSLITLSVAAAGMWATLGPFWTIPSRILQPRGAVALAAGIAATNSIGNLGGFIGPFIIGQIKNVSPDFTNSLLFLAACVAIGGIVVLFSCRDQSEEKHLSQQDR